MFCLLCKSTPPTKLAEGFTENLNIVDRFFFRKKNCPIIFFPPNICRINRLEVSFANPARVILGIINSDDYVCVHPHCC
jgi:hypothetical protein